MSYLSPGSPHPVIPSPHTPVTSKSPLSARASSSFSSSSHKSSSSSYGTPQSHHHLQFHPYQIIPGATEVSDKRAFSWNIIRGDEYIVGIFVGDAFLGNMQQAYISGAKVIIYQNSSIQQILSFPYKNDTTDTNIAPHSPTGSTPIFKGKIPQNLQKETFKLISFCNDRIIAVTESYIYIFSNLVNKTTTELGTKTTSHNHSHWFLEQILCVDFSIKCISTNRFGDRFIVAGDQCHMYRFKNFSKGYKHWRLVWKEKMPNIVRQVQISPDDRLFATLSHRSVPLVKIWYKSFSTVRQNQNYEHYSFLYLKHNKPIERVEWRSKEIMESDTPNVLMTYSEDGIQRFWMETSLREELHFYVCHATKKPNAHMTHFLCTPHELSPNEVIMRHSLSKRIDVGDAGHQDIFSQNDVALSSSSAHRLTISESNSVHQYESQTWIMTVYKDGSVEIEMICGLADLPRRTPTVTTWSRIINAFDSNTLSNIHHKCFAFYSCSENTSANPNIIGHSAPSVITIYSQSLQGQLCNYVLMLSSSFSRAANVRKSRGSLSPGLPPPVPLHLNSVLSGHRHFVSKIIAHRLLPLAASYDSESHQLIIWHIRDSAFFSPHEILTNIHTVYDIDISEFEFFPTQPALFVSTPRGIEILYIKSQRPLAYENLLNSQDASVAGPGFGSSGGSASQKRIFPPLPAYYTVIRLDRLQDSEEFANCSYMKILPLSVTEGDDLEDAPLNCSMGGEESAHVVALSQDKAEIGIWKVKLADEAESPTVDPHHTQFKENIFEEGDSDASDADSPATPFFQSEHLLQQVLNYDVTCMDCETTLSIDPNKSCESPANHCHTTSSGTKICSSISVALGTSDGKVHVYRTRKQKRSSGSRSAPKRGLFAKFSQPQPQILPAQEIMKLEEQAQFDVEEDVPLRFVKCCAQFSRIATVTKDCQQVTIWEAVSQNKFHKQQHINISRSDDEIRHLEWYTFADGLYILAMGTNDEIECYTEGRKDLNTGSESLWELMAVLKKSRTYDPCNCFTITKERTIIASFGKNIQVFTKWQHTDDEEEITSDYYLSRVREKHRRLPDYHPKLLEDLLMSGDFLLVRDIFIHLAHHVNKQNTIPRSEGEPLYIPLLPVDFFLSQKEKDEQNKKPAPQALPQRRTTLLDRFKGVSLDSDSDSDEPEEKEAAKSSSTVKPEEEKKSFVQLETDMDFSEAHKILTEWIPNIRLPELSGIDQMNLMAILDTFHRVKQKPEALDDAAIRYFVACTNALYLHKSKKSSQIKSAHKAWMMHSETQESLMRMMSFGTSGKMTWPYVKRLGIPYWVNSTEQLKKMAQQMVRDRFSESNDPSTCALIYLALGKKSTLIQLYKAVGEEKIAKFLARDFDPSAPEGTQKRTNCVLAARNAYKLIGQHKFEYAAAFFFLSGSMKDTLDLLIKKVDILMAYFVLRLVRGDDHEETISFVHDHLIPHTRDNLKDPWLTSIAHWRCREYEESISVLCHPKRASLRTFDASLYTYCERISAKTQLANTNIFEKKKRSLLLRVSYYFMHTGEIVLALENLKLLNALSDVDDEASSQSQQTKLNDPSASVMSGMIDMSSFGMGMPMGGAMRSSPMMQQQMGGGSMNNSRRKKSSIESDEDSASVHVALSKMLKFKTALVLMTQELDDLSLKPFPSPQEDWNAFQSRINAEVELLETFEVDRDLLLRKMKEYSKLNGHLLSRCILSPDANITSIMHSVAYQVVALLSKMYQSKLPGTHIQTMHNFLKEFVYCYERCEAANVHLTNSQRADFGACLFSILFISAWSRNDFTSIEILLNLSKNMSSGAKSSSQHNSNTSLYDSLMFKLPEFYHTFNARLKKAHEEKEIERQLQAEQSTNTRKFYYGRKSPRATHSRLSQKRSSVTSLASTSKSEQDAHVQQIKNNYYDVVFEAVLLSEFVESVKSLLHTAYSSEAHDADMPYSITARAIISSLSLWFSIVQDKLQYKQLELYAATNQLPTRGFREVATLSFARSQSHLSNLVKTLVFSARQSHKRKSTRLTSNRSSITDFHSLVHAIPELKQGKDSSARTRLLELLDDVSLSGMSNLEEEKQKVWDIISSTVLASLEDQTEDASSTEEFTSISDASSFAFSDAIEIVKSKDPVKAFCINRSQPEYMAFASHRMIREVNIEHSICYRKRNSSLEKLLDEEMPSWESSLHRFDDEASEDVSTVGTPANHMSQRSAETMAGFMHPLDEPDADALSSPSIGDAWKGVGVSNARGKKKKSIWKRTAKQIKRAHRSRRPSFTRPTNSSMHHFRPSKHNIQVIDHRVPVSVLVSHPFLPFYLSGGSDGSLYLWQFQQDQPVRAYKYPGNPAITNVKFGQFGYKFGASNDKGYVMLWRFDAGKDALQEFDKFHCHSDRTNDFTFLNSGSVIATIGTSNSIKELCIWDMLLPEHESLIVKEVLEEEPSSITFASQFNYLLIGCKKGEILVYSVTDQHFLHKITMDDRNIETISVDLAEDFFIVGCSDGHMSVYDMHSFRQLYVFKHEHGKKGGIFNIGDNSCVTGSAIVDEFLYSSGVDGRVLRRSIQL